MSLDQSFFQVIHALAGISPIGDVLGVLFARYIPYVIVFGLVVAVFFTSDWRVRVYRSALFSLSVIIARGFFVEVLHLVLSRSRPASALGFKPLIVLPGDSSFPSSHASVFFAIAAVVFCMNWRWGTFLGVCAALIGIARVFVGVHWPLDVVTGALIGIVSGVAAYLFVSKYKPLYDVEK